MSSYYEKILATGEVKCIDEEVPFEIPQGWEWCRLFEVGKTETGTTPSKSHPEYFGDYIPFLGPANILNSKIVSVTQGLSDKGVYYGRIVPKNTILQVCIGGSIGKCAITDKPVTFNQQINSITPYLCNVEFVHIVLQSEYFRQAIMDKATGTATPIINRGNWENLLFPLPPINEQERIVASITELTHFLGIYSNKQEELNALNTNMYQRMKKAILQEAIQGKLVPQIEEEGNAQELLEQIKTEKQKLVKEGKLKKSALNDSVIFRGDDNKYYEQIGKTIVCIDEEIPFSIPNNWAWSRLSSMCSIVNGFTPLRSESKFWDCGTINWFTVEDIKNQGEMIYSTKQKITDEATSKERIVRAGSVLLCCTASVGQCALAKIDLTTNQQFNALTVKDVNISILTDNYLFWFAKTLKSTLQRLSGKTTFEFVSVKKVGNILIPIPPFQEQQRIVAQIEKLFEQLR